jgi:methanogenic corrinoid protein MtbC1
MLGHLIGAPRAMLLQSLVSGEKSVGELVELTALSQPNISNHLSRLLKQGLVQRRREGRKMYYSLTDTRVQSLISKASSLADQADLSEVCEGYIQALLKWDIDRAERTILQAANAGANWRDLFMSALLPALQRVGDGWAQGKISISQEHAASVLTEKLIARLLPEEVPAPPRTRSNSLVIGSAPGDYHCIGVKMTTGFLREAGFRVINLGPNVPKSEFLRAADQKKAEWVIVSLCVKALEPECLETIRALKEKKNPAKVIAGGLVPKETPIPFLAAGVDAIAQSPAHAVCCIRKPAENPRE